MAAKEFARLFCIPQIIKTRVFSEYIPGWAVFSFSMCLNPAYFRNENKVIQIVFASLHVYTTMQKFGLGRFEKYAARPSSQQNKGKNDFFSFIFKKSMCMFCITTKQTAALNIFEDSVCFIVCNLICSLQLVEHYFVFGCQHKSDLNHKIIAIQIIQLLLLMLLIVNFILIRGGDLIICLLVQSPVFGSCSLKELLSNSWMEKNKSSVKQ